MVLALYNSGNTSQATNIPPTTAPTQLIMKVMFVLKPSSGDPTKVPALIEVPVAAKATSQPGMERPAVK